jgi:hypothetical protein
MFVVAFVCLVVGFCLGTAVFALLRAADEGFVVENRVRCAVCGRVVGPNGRCPVGCGYQPDAGGIDG